MHLRIFFTLVDLTFRVWGHLVCYRIAKILSHQVLVIHVVDHNMTGIWKPSDYVRRLKMWPIRAEERKEGVYTFLRSP